MALIKCPNCGREISDKADVCPHCGYNLSTAGETAEKKNKKIDKNKIIGLCSGRIKYILLGIGLVAIMLVLTVYISNYTAMNAVERYFEAVNEQLQNVEIVYEEPEETLNGYIQETITEDNNDENTIDEEDSTIEDKKEDIPKEFNSTYNGETIGVVDNLPENLKNVVFTYAGDSKGATIWNLYFRVTNNSDHDININYYKQGYVDNNAITIAYADNYNSIIPAGKSTILKAAYKMDDLEIITDGKIDKLEIKWYDEDSEEDIYVTYENVNLDLSK